MKKSVLTILVTGIMSMTVSAVTATAFSDVPATSPYYSSVEALTQAGVIEGYEDGTFRPEQPINRAEAIKMVLAGIGVEVGNGLYNTGFSDVPLDVWYAGFVMEGSLRGIVNGNPDGTFAGTRTVNKAEFLKMTEQAFQVDLSEFQTSSGNIASDVAAGEWYTPYMAYAKAAGLTYATLDNELEPAKALTRGECAQILHKMMYIKQGGQVQELLSMAEASLIDALMKVYRSDVDGALAQAQTARAKSEEALEMNPDSTTVQATNLLSQAFQKLFYAYKDGRDENYASVVANVNEAKNLANQAVETNQSAQYFADQVHTHGDTLLSQLGY